MPVSMGQAQRDAKSNFSSNSGVISLTLTLCLTLPVRLALTNVQCPY